MMCKLCVYRLSVSNDLKYDAIRYVCHCYLFLARLTELLQYRNLTVGNEGRGISIDMQKNCNVNHLKDSVSLAPLSCWLADE